MPRGRFRVVGHQRKIWNTSKAGVERWGARGTPEVVYE